MYICWLETQNYQIYTDNFSNNFIVWEPKINLPLKIKNFPGTLIEIF